MSWKRRQRQSENNTSFHRHPNHHIISQTQEQLRSTTKSTKFAYHYDTETEIAGQCQKAVDMFYANPIFEDPELITTVQKKMVQKEIWREEQNKEMDFDDDGLPCTPSASEDESDHDHTYHYEPAQVENNVIDFGPTIYGDSAGDIMQTTRNHQLLNEFGNNTLRNDQIPEDEDNMYFNDKMYMKQMMVLPAKDKQYHLSDFVVKKKQRKKKNIKNIKNNNGLNVESPNKKRRRRGGRGGKNKHNKNLDQWEKKMIEDQRKAKELVSYIENAKITDSIFYQ